MAAEKVTARSVEPGQYDLILDPTNLWLTIHESISHPTELDRAIGEEANFAGTSFIARPEKVIGQLRFDAWTNRGDRGAAEGNSRRRHGFEAPHVRLTTARGLKREALHKIGADQ